MPHILVITHILSNGKAQLATRKPRINAKLLISVSCNGAASAWRKSPAIQPTNVTKRDAETKATENCGK